MYQSYIFQEENQGKPWKMLLVTKDYIFCEDGNMKSWYHYQLQAEEMNIIIEDS